MLLNKLPWRLAKRSIRAAYLKWLSFPPRLHTTKAHGSQNSGIACNIVSPLLLILRERAHLWHRTGGLKSCSFAEPPLQK